MEDWFRAFWALSAKEVRKPGTGMVMVEWERERQWHNRVRGGLTYQVYVL